MHFPNLKLSDWETTRNSLQKLSQIIGAIRQNLNPRMKHWMHINLRPDVRGLTTPMIPVTGEQAFGFKIQLDLRSHQCQIITSRGENLTHDLKGQSIHSFYHFLKRDLEKLGIDASLNSDEFSDETVLDYDHEAVHRYQQALVQVAMIFEEFKAGLREETSTINLWPHHFDLAFLWFSGRLVPDTDPEDEENADEQMSFGFSTGDSGIPDPYFYFMAYPWQEEIKEANLPTEAKWQSEGWNGAVLTYDALVESDDPKKILLDYMHATFEQGRKLMQK